MPNLTRPQPPDPPTVQLLRRSAHLLDLRSPIETRIIVYILWEGSDLRWTMYKRANVAAEVGCILDVHLEVVKRSLRNLSNRGWLRRGTDSEGQPYLQLTPTYTQASESANRRMKVRRALGPGMWQKLNGNDSTADAVHMLATTKTQARYKTRVNAAAAELIANDELMGKSGSKVNPRRKQSASSKGSLRTRKGFTLLPGKNA